MTPNSVDPLPVESHEKVLKVLRNRTARQRQNIKSAAFGWIGVSISTMLF